MIRRLRQWLCFHPDALRSFVSGRMALRCPDCGHVSEGWSIGAAPASQEESQ